MSLESLRDRVNILGHLINSPDQKPYSDKEVFEKVLQVLKAALVYCPEDPERHFFTAGLYTLARNELGLCSSCNRALGSNDITCTHCERNWRQKYQATL